MGTITIVIWRGRDDLDLPDENDTNLGVTILAASSSGSVAMEGKKKQVALVPISPEML